MKPLKDFKSTLVTHVFTDIDDTLTDHGKLKSNAYAALWELQSAGIAVVPVTGRPAGWCEMIARMWPVDGVIGENGAFYFRYDQTRKKMHRHFNISENDRVKHRVLLEKICAQVLHEVPGSAVASDQFARVSDLAIGFCEDVPALSEADVDRIVRVFKSHGAVAKVSSIHVNGWFGDFDKLTMCREFVTRELGMNFDRDNAKFAFVGDSPNDEPMFAAFENSFAVANIRNFIARLKHLPKYIAGAEGGEGFVQIMKALL